MSIVERVKAIIEGKPDGHHHALMHLAEEMQNSGGAGLSTDVVASLKNDLGEKIDQHMEAISQNIADERKVLSSRLDELEAKLVVGNKPDESKPGTEGGDPKPGTEAGVETQS